MPGNRQVANRFVFGKVILVAIWGVDFQEPGMDGKRTASRVFQKKEYRGAG